MSLWRYRQKHTTYIINIDRLLVGMSGLPVHKLAHLQQKFHGGASKGQLLDAIDGLVNNLDEDSRDRFVTACIEEILQCNENLREELEKILGRVGWGLSDTNIYPLRLNIDLETSDLDETAKDGISKCLTRYRNGDYDGAITSICGVVDSITENICAQKSLGNHKSDSYQQRVSRSFQEMKHEYISPLKASNLPADEIKRLWNNHRGAVNQAAYILGAFRRECADVHGARKAPPELIQKALDCAVFIVRALLSCT